MKRRIGWMLALAALMLVPGVASAEAEASGEVVLEGSFVWAREDGDRTGDLKATFTPEEGQDNTWAVAFEFVWEEEPHTYLGTATGSLVDGELTGTADNDSEEHKMTFEFGGTVENGTFDGTHSYTDEEGNRRELGTLTLGAPAPAS